MQTVIIDDLHGCGKFISTIQQIMCVDIKNTGDLH